MKRELHTALRHKKVSPSACLPLANSIFLHSQRPMRGLRLAAGAGTHVNLKRRSAVYALLRITQFITQAELHIRDGEASFWS